MPGGISEGSLPVLRFAADGGFAIYNTQKDDGVRILSFDAAGRPLKAKRLSSEKLRVQKRLADIELVLSRLRDVKPGDAEKPLAPVRKEFQRLDGFEKTLEAAWDKVDDWENVPVKP